MHMRSKNSSKMMGGTLKPRKNQHHTNANSSKPLSLKARSQSSTHKRPKSTKNGNALPKSTKSRKDMINAKNIETLKRKSLSKTRNNENEMTHSRKEMMKYTDSTHVLHEPTINSCDLMS